MISPEFILSGTAEREIRLELDKSMKVFRHNLVTCNKLVIENRTGRVEGVGHRITAGSKERVQMYAHMPTYYE